MSVPSGKKRSEHEVKTGMNESISLNLNYPRIKEHNVYATKVIAFDHYFTQKLIMTASAQAYIFFPGGYGTLDNFTELVTLQQTKKMVKIPIILIGKDFWQPFLKFIKESLYTKFKTIAKEDMALYTLVDDDINKAYQLIKKTKPRQYF